MLIKEEDNKLQLACVHSSGTASLCDTKVFKQLDHSLQKLHGLGRARLHGERNSVPYNKSEAVLPILLESFCRIIRMTATTSMSLDFISVWLPSTTIATEQLNGSKNDKARITCMAYCNGTGSDKVTLPMIGMARRPRAFGRNSGQELGFNYCFKSKA